MSLDTLAERVMQWVKCPGIDFVVKEGKLHGHPSDCFCHGTGAVLDPRWAALREALWEEKAVNCEDETCLAGGTWKDGARRHHLHNETVRRNRAEAAWRLPDAIRASGWTYQMGGTPEQSWATVYLHGNIHGPEPLWADDPWDALSAALLAWIAQEVKA